MGEYFKVLKREARRRYDARMSPGRAAADISMGKYDNWIGPERIVMDTVAAVRRVRRHAHAGCGRRRQPSNHGAIQRDQIPHALGVAKNHVR
jgi:hypothetical protein